MSSSSASDRDLSESSNSPISYTVGDSPYSSPSQQVLQLTNNLTELTCTEKTFHYLSNDQPKLLIIEQPQNHFRFRYVSEMVGTHGCLIAKSHATNKTKTHPTVELMNYNGRALIRCQLAQCDVEEDHPHRLLEEEQDRDVSSYVPEHNSYQVRFAGMGIIHTAKKDVPGLLFKKFSEKLKGQSYNPKELRMECDNMAKKINLNIVRLKFSAHDVETGKEICKPAFSEPIHNMKSAATNDLKICRISQYSGRPRGGEDVFILVEKVNKKNIIIRFLELDETGATVWTSTGSFMQSDVHHQYAIVFRTPPYQNPQTPVDVKVFIELVRLSDGRTSERKPFTYKAEQVYKQIKKRKNNSSYSSLDSSSGGSITNEIPTTVLTFPNSNDNREDELPLFIIQQLPLPVGSPNHCGLGNALGTSINTIASPINTTASPINTMASITTMASPHNAMASPHDAMSPIDAMASHMDAISSTTRPAPMWGGAGCAAPGSGIPNLRLHSAEIDEIIGRDVDMTADDRRELTEADWSQYVSSFNSLSDLHTEEQNPIGDIIRASTELVADSGRDKQNPIGDIIRASTVLVADSGRVKVEPSTSKSPPAQSTESTADKPHETAEYDAFYKPEDGLEVKKLVQELCQIIKNKKGYKKQEVRSKLERLFEIRLSNGDTFLHMTLCSKQPSFESIVKIISSVNMSHLLNYANNKQETILHLAVIHGTPKLIALLVAKGCDPMLKNLEDDTVIQHAVRYNMKLLEPLLEAIKTNNVPCDLNSCNSEKQTALHLAALADCGASAALLLRHGAGCSARDAAGRTPLHLAAYDARPAAVRALADRIPPSEIDAIDGGGNTALQIVCGRPVCDNTIEMVQLLLQKKADPHKHEEHNESAWRLARRHARVRACLQPAARAAPHALEDDVKSEPEDEYESADEDMPDVGLQELGRYAREVADRMDASGAWKQLAQRLRADGLTNWFASQPSPTYRLLYHIKEYRDDVTSKSLALVLDDIGEIEAANIIKGYLD